MNKSVFKMLAGLTLAAFAAAAEKDQPKVPQHQDPYVNGATDESRIAREVRHQLVTLPYFGVFDDLGFTVNGGTVTLVGEVTRPTLKSDAGNVVKKVEGVTEVINNIEVLPLSPNDDRVRPRETLREECGVRHPALQPRTRKPLRSNPDHTDCSDDIRFS